MVAWRRNILNPKENISSSTVRRFIDSRFGVQLKYLLSLKKKWKRRRRKKINWTRSAIKYRVSIDDRPEEISHPVEPWHYEVDLIESIKTDPTCILRLIDKLLRKNIAIKIPNKNAERIEKIIEELVKKEWIKSLTFDNGLEFAYHYKLWVLTFFCHSYHAREKWQVERSNRMYRKYFPKGTKLFDISQKEIDKATKEINDTPMKCLEYLTPNEFEQKIKNKKVNL